DKTGEERYLAGIEARAEKLLTLEPKFTDDLAHRILFFRRVLPDNYAALKENSSQSQQVLQRITRQVEQDERALRSSQRDDGAWGFTPGQVDRNADPAPTALALDALVALGADQTDPAVARGVQSLLAMQHPYGLWNRSAKTGFVTTTYVMHAQSRLFPEHLPKLRRQDFVADANESLHDTIARMRLLAYLDPWSAIATEDAPDELFDLLFSGAVHTS